MIKDVFRAEVRRPAPASEGAAQRHPPVAVEWEHNRRLCAAVMDGQLHLLRRLLVEEGHDPNARDENGNTVGHQAATDDDHDALGLLLCHGWNVDAVNNDGDTALHLASKHGAAKAANALADGFPDDNIRNRRGFTALDEATRVATGTSQCKSCITEFTTYGKPAAMEIHARAEQDRFEKLIRNKEILFGRDVDTLPRGADFRPNRSTFLTAEDKARVTASLQATIVTQRCVAAGLQSAVVTILEGRHHAADD